MSYFVDFVNETDRTWTMAVYQKLPNSLGLDSVVWKKTTVPSGGASGIKWDISYLVALANYKQERRDDVYKASQTKKNIKLGSEWRVDWKEGVQQLVEVGSCSSHDLIVINNDSHRFADVGVGMSGTPSNYKKNVPSGSGAQFKITPVYYVGLFNDVKIGTVVSSNVVVGPLKLEFEKGENQALLTAKMTRSTIDLKLTYCTNVSVSYEEVENKSRLIGSEFKDDPLSTHFFKGAFVLTSIASMTWVLENWEDFKELPGVTIESVTQVVGKTLRITGKVMAKCPKAISTVVSAINEVYSDRTDRSEETPESTDESEKSIFILEDCAIEACDPY